MILGDRVTKLREELNLTQKDLADMLGVTLATVSNWENFKSTPTSSNLEMLATVLNTTTDYLLGRVDMESQSVPEMPAVMPKTVKPESRSPGIFARLLKYALCCVIGLFSAVLILTAFKGEKAGMCFPVAFAIAGILTAITARRKGEDSAFTWWTYGALVPIVSWIDVAMLGAENKAKAFMKGLAFTVMGLLAFLAVFGSLLPSPPQQSAQIEASVKPAVSVDVAPVSVDSVPVPNVSTDAEKSAARAKHDEEMSKATAGTRTPTGSRKKTH